jgi:hypothetical protein
MFEGVPPGTYTITQERGGAVTTSEPVELAVEDVDYWIDVRNYTTDVLPEHPDNGETTPYVDAYHCVDTSGNRVYGLAFFADYGYLPSGDDDATGELAASSTTLCTDETAGAYEFQLESVGTGDVAAAAVYQLPESSEFPGFYSLTDEDATIPTGMYVLRDLKTGWVSSPMAYMAEYNRIEFYGIAPNGGTVDPGDGGGDTLGGEEPRPGDGDPEEGGDSGAPVTQLPSTGDGTTGSMNGWLPIALASLALLLMAGAMRSERIRRR